ncbi:MAG: hypothetical protein B6241_12060 [Spirochaetaceae bacterium 4572_59]|nr:MAG: hypothetical protein B6241_12060 [Spirochaetaceae bacterium 4572_59]
MKKILIVGVMVVAAAGSIFASGNKEDDAQDLDAYGRGSRGGYDRQGRFDRDERGFRGPESCWIDEEGNPVTPETVDVEGTLVLEEGTMPYLEQNGEKVFLMVPRFALNEIELDGGEFVKLTGFELPEDARSPWGNSESSSLFLHVVSAEIDGEVLTLEMGYGPRGGRGSKGRRS